MHRKVKGLLSLILTVAMVTASAAPSFAEELPGEQPTGEQPIVEVVETEPEQPVQAEETIPVEESGTEEAVSVEEQTTEETIPVEEPGTEEAVSVEEQPTEENIAESGTEIETEGEQQPTEEQPDTEIADAEPVPAEPSETGTESVLSTDAELEEWYDSLLTEGQKKFKVYAGNHPLNEAEEADRVFLGTGIIPDDEFLDAQSGTLLKILLNDYRLGDFNFYKLSEWNVWSVDSNGAPQSILTRHSSLSRLATKANFLRSAYIRNNGTGTNPQIEFQNPILEPVWSCIDYAIPVFDADGNDTGTTITVNAENYNNLVFPDVKADSWKLVYAETEYGLNTASEIWTNPVNGIKTVGRDFSEPKARLQAVVSQTILKEGSAEFTQPDWYEGQPMAAPIVSSETNGIENITYFYKEAGAEDSTYTTTVPEKAGAYTAAAVFAATEEYKEVIKFADFNILPNIPAEEPDNTAPVISGVSDGETCYGDRIITVTDEHLKLVTVNGEAVAITDNRAEITLKPSEEVYKIAAADEADNKVEYTVEVLEAWVRDGINENGKKKLKGGRVYKLGSGQWTVDGDGTVYGSGNFYVKNGGEYDFKRREK